MLQKLKSLIERACIETMTPLKIVIAAKIMVVWPLWPATAVAAASIYATNADGRVTLAEIAVTILISILSGATSLLYRVQRQLESSSEVKYVWILATSHMSGAVVAGLLMFFLTEAQGLSDLNQVVAVIPASFGGVFFLEQAFLWIANKYIPVKSGTNNPFTPKPSAPPSHPPFFEGHSDRHGEHTRIRHSEVIDEPRKPPQEY